MFSCSTCLELCLKCKSGAMMCFLPICLIREPSKPATSPQVTPLILQRLALSTANSPSKPHMQASYRLHLYTAVFPRAAELQSVSLCASAIHFSGIQQKFARRRLILRSLSCTRVDINCGLDCMQLATRRMFIPAIAIAHVVRCLSQPVSSLAFPENSHALCMQKDATLAAVRPC